MPTSLTHPTQAWPIAAALLDALSRRNFDALQDCLDDRVRFRALVPSGAFQLDGAGDTAAKFRAWFGGDDAFEVADAAVGQLGTRMYARWRVRMWPPGRPGQARVAEQHVFTTGDQRLDTIDLLCSGFLAEVAT
ncbi:MAG: nuclear transport factor 2 family protein [Actinomycetota bacterium]|nr:nuclear transport factor 2 family protein [Actinomycetota bacterium]